MWLQIRAQFEHQCGRRNDWLTAQKCMWLGHFIAGRCTHAFPEPLHNKAHYFEMRFVIIAMEVEKVCPAGRLKDRTFVMPSLYFNRWVEVPSFVPLFEYNSAEMAGMPGFFAALVYCTFVTNLHSLPWHIWISQMFTRIDNLSFCSYFDEIFCLYGKAIQQRFSPNNGSFKLRFYECSLNFEFNFLNALLCEKSHSVAILCT